MSFHFDASRAVVKDVLRRPSGREWTVQGFGMLRTYLDDEHHWRLNVWDSSLMVPGVSLIHDHPWDFKSLVLAGKFTNVRFDVYPTEARWATHEWAMIVPGADGGLTENQRGFATLSAHLPENFASGNIYSQEAKEVHQTQYSDGAVTINERIRTGDDLARVFWPNWSNWVDAKPRLATREEVHEVTQRALGGFR